MSDHVDSTVTIQTSAESVLSPSSWFGEVVVVAHALRHLGVLATIEEWVRFGAHDRGVLTTSTFFPLQLFLSLSPAKLERHSRGKLHLHNIANMKGTR